MENEFDLEENLIDEELEESFDDEDEGVAAEEAMQRICGSAHPDIERFRLFLMFCAAISMLGIPGNMSSLVKLLCNFAPIAFFILSGMLILSDPENRSERIGRAIKRTAIAFVILAVVYIAINLFVYQKMGADIRPALTSRRLWFNFAALNYWPLDVGQAIWYVQSLLYSYIIIYFIDKLHLLHLDWIFFAVLFVIAVVTGEFTGFIHFNIFGYTFFPPNFFNRALPYILLGCFFGRTVSRWAYIHPVVYVAGLLVGIGMVVLEPIALYNAGVPGYYDHLIGMAVIAVSLVLLLFQNLIHREFDGYEDSPVRDFILTRWNTNFIYYLYQPLAMVLGLFCVRISSDFFAQVSDYLGLITFLILLAFTLLWAFIYNRINANMMAGEIDDDEYIE